MQIEIDFQVYKALTALRESEADSYNNVLRGLLDIPVTPQVSDFEPALQRIDVGNDFDLAPFMKNRTLPGVWYGDVHFPPGTKFRATYKGQTHYAEVRNNKWVGEDGRERRSPSDAARAISGTNVNGWRFWHTQHPDDPKWRRLDELKR